MVTESNINEIDAHLDGLTGCRSRQGLHYDINMSLFETARGMGRYKNKFLCIDIDNFQKFLDYNGFGASDQVLIRIADNLRKIYPKSKIYRFGGDEFVVEGTDEWKTRANHGVEVELKYAIVYVDTEVKKGRHHSAVSWVMLHIHSGVVRAQKQGLQVKCGDREEEIGS